jgi:hypothetical protein
MADGSQLPIEQVNVGDDLIATDPVTGRTSVEPVVATIVGHGDKALVDVTLEAADHAGGGPAVLTATDGHPFWVAERRAWLPASDLLPGQHLLTSTGELVEIVAVGHREQRGTVHNLTVATVHTYYVQAGEAAVLTHNCAQNTPRQPQHRKPKSPVPERLKDQAMKRAMEPHAHAADSPRNTIVGMFSRLGGAIGKFFDIKHGATFFEYVGRAAGAAFGSGVKRVVSGSTKYTPRHRGHHSGVGSKRSAYSKPAAKAKYQPRSPGVRRKYGGSFSQSKPQVNRKTHGHLEF